MKEYIDREAAIEFIKENQCKACSDIGLCGNCAVLVAMKLFKSIPAADVWPAVRGKWRLYSPLTDTYECDKCCYQIIDESFRTNFCPNCGARMDGGADDAAD